MKVHQHLIIILLFICTTFFSFNNEKKNEYVNVDISVEQKKFLPGDSVSFSFKFKPQKGIHILTDPAITVKIDSSKDFSAINTPIIPTTKKSDYFDISKTITQTIVLSKKLKSGITVIRGTLTYFFCSEQEGWCRKFNHPFEIKVKIIK